MKLKSKLLLEVVILFILIGGISAISIINTKYVQETFSSINTETLPILNTLKNMRYASTHLSALTNEIILIEDETRNASENEFAALEETLETNFYKIEEAKLLFNESFSEYSDIVSKSYPQDVDQIELVAEKWNEMLFISNKMIQLKTSGASGGTILNLNNDFDFSYVEMNMAIDKAIELTTANIDQREIYVESLLRNVTWSIIIALNLFVATTLIIRFYILRSISKPLNKIKSVTRDIAKGNFVLYPEKGNDEISELGKDINIMSKDLKELNKKMIDQERMTSIGGLAIRLAHDIRNPLSVIQNGFEIIKLKTKNNSDPSLNSNFESISRSVARITHQIDDVLNFINISELHNSKNSLSSILKSTLQSMLIPENVKIILSENDSTILCDSSKLNIVFKNLIDNACYAINGNGEIRIRIIESQDDVLVEIEDSGSGVPDSILEKIFEPLFTTKQVGTGLGLSSCKSIVEAHGGKISVRNNPTTFTIRLPKNLQKTEESTINNSPNSMIESISYS
ncbi:sensor histidine kinase [Candidatus Nitrosarchaeum limnium]|uniref:sensor histidine kinase n=1 Tax=Candidatus Nitrosarchaeum limnium TaxID=1007084 RepID=UPI00026CE2AA|nr:HAMP domain-containing sensor histidine kinase [Candidatus Nitrosarchaeum limnium]